MNLVLRTQYPVVSTRSTGVPITLQVLSVRLQLSPNLPTSQVQFRLEAAMSIYCFCKIHVGVVLLVVGVPIIYHQKSGHTGHTSNVNGPNSTKNVKVACSYDLSTVLGRFVPATFVLQHLSQSQ